MGVDLLHGRGLRYAFDEVPGALELMRDKLRGRACRYQLPSLVDLHFAPSVYMFGMPDWSRFDKIVDAGYRHGVEQLEKPGDAAVAPYRYR